MDPCVLQYPAAPVRLRHRRTIDEDLLYGLFISLQATSGYTPAVSPISSARSTGDVGPLQGTAHGLGSLWAACLAHESNRRAIIAVVDYDSQDTNNELHPDDTSEEGGRVNEVANTHQQKTDALAHAPGRMPGLTHA